MPILYGYPSDVGPYRDCVTITPNDSTDLTNGPTRGLLLSAAGTVVVDTVGGSASRTLPLQAGWNPVSVKRVYSTGTTAGITILACY